MKKVTLLCGMLLALTASIASAGSGVNLRWNACFGDGGAINRAFACNSNAGSNLAVGSFELGTTLLQTSGNEIVVDLASATATLPAWWGYKNVGTCRQLAAAMNGIIAASAVNCQDWSGGQASGGIGAYNIGARGPNTSRVVAALAVPAAALADLFPAQEYFSFNFTFNNTKTVGTGACAGCNVGICLVFNSVKLTTPPVVGQPSRDITLTGPTNGTDSDFCTWQGPVAPVVQGVVGCGQATPTRNATWSSVKALYR